MHVSAVLFEELSGQDGRLGLITLNRPEALNALNHEMVIQIHQALLGWEEDPHIKAVLIRAAEGRAFCAGGDLRLVYERHQAGDTDIAAFFRDEYRLNHYIYHYSKPYIAFLDGLTLGGGAGLSLHGSHRLGTERLSFAMPETAIGFFPDVGGTYFLSRLPQGMGFYLALSGARLSVDDCLEMELIDYKVSSPALAQILKALSDTPFDDNAYESVSQILQLFQQVKSPSPLMTTYAPLGQHFIKPRMEDIFAALGGSSTAFCQEALANLKKKSPTSLKVVLRQMHEGLKRDFDDCLQLEYHLMSHFLQSHDFYEGIRALIVDKDQNPQWRPQTLEELSDSFIDSYFLPLSGIEAQLLFT